MSYEMTEEADRNLDRHIGRLEADRSRLRQTVEEQGQRLASWRAVARLVDDGETCTLDPDGACQPHSGGNPCEIAALRQLLEDPEP